MANHTDVSLKDDVPPAQAAPFPLAAQPQPTPVEVGAPFGPFMMASMGFGAQLAGPSGPPHSDHGSELQRKEHLIQKMSVLPPNILTTPQFWIIFWPNFSALKLNMEVRHCLLFSLLISKR